MNGAYMNGGTNKAVTYNQRWFSNFGCNCSHLRIDFCKILYHRCANAVAHINRMAQFYNS